MRFVPVFLLILVSAGEPDDREFFESRIRPVLAQECYGCHAVSTKKKGGLALDSRAGLLKGGSNGPAVVPGKPAESLLLKTLRHEDPDLKMPRDGAKLDPATVRDFEAWIARGAYDPRDQPATREEVAKETSFAAILQRRKTWWSFQPIAAPVVPDLPGVAHPVDRFLLSRLQAAGLRPAPEADPRTFARRCCLVLTGLPPAPEEVDAFAAEYGRNPEAATEALVDRLLASPRFGERWARHWMDVVRYAETHGSEGDPGIPHAWRYRDYLIRALNADLPYSQFVREQIAGDLLEPPRVEGGVNESALGIGHLRMVLHGYSPTDSLDELVTFTDNQIDTVSKAFLGLTVSCARCHDHKFDALSQGDFTSFYGIFSSTRPAVIDVNLPDRQRLHVDRIAALKSDLRAALAERWLASLDEAVSKLRAWSPDPKKPVTEGPLAAWARLSKAPPDQWTPEWARLQAQDAERARQLEAFRAQAAVVRWDLRGDDFKAWIPDGAGLACGPSAAGEFALPADGDLAVSGILPAGLYSHLTTDKHRAMIASPRFKAEAGKLWIRLRGEKARARYVVQNYPRSGTIHYKADVTSDVDQWVAWPMEYWAGDRLQIEISTLADAPLEGADRGRSWFGASEVLYARDGRLVPPSGRPALARLRPASDPDTLGASYRAALQRALEEWRDGKLDDDGADFLSAFLRAGFLPNRAADFPLVQEIRRLEKEIPEPSRAAGVLEGDAADAALFVRGNHKQPAQIVPRRFLEALDPAPYPIAPGRSGRRELAESLVAPSNPFFARVMVNRLWQHLFGRGLVATPDNFGRLGELPTHPELLDDLARRFLENKGSLKAMIRFLATSQAFRRDSRPGPDALRLDPDNLLLSHYSSRRLEAEAIRDGMLSLTGKLDLAMGGPSAEGSSYRRSVYVRVVRNNLDPFLSAFDFPVPSACRGRRDSTNVPAQSLGLMNDPMVARWADDWARRHASLDPDAAISRMFAEAYGRAPAAGERDLARAHVSEAGLKSLALALLNTKEFIYVR
ncbi:MAG: PSD1 domain-containing protein [Planctomycetaceae bacterium]|nr:PSD1 domain-containing protein [Planctomycetaceae bacterium]